MTHPEPSNSDLSRAVAAAMGYPEALADLRALYRQLDADVQGGLCLGGGACCRFDLAGHRLYVTPLELAMLLQLPPIATVPPQRCPYQVGPKCHAREHRALGCRTYFCRQGHLQDLYEMYHDQIIALHKQHGIPYFYVELTASLTECKHPAY